MVAESLGRWLPLLHEWVLGSPRQCSFCVEVVWRLRPDNLSFIDSTPVADLAALTGWLVCMYLVWKLLELSTLDTRRFLFRLPESLSRWLRM